jgi:Fic family protein
MISISQKQQKLLAIFLKNGVLSSSQIYQDVVDTGGDISLVTIKRTLSQMVEAKILASTGSGPATKYEIASLGRIFADIDPQEYCATDPDKRWGLSRYNFDLLSSLPPDLFTALEQEMLRNATLEYQRRAAFLPSAIQKKELERLIIELSWKSSKIEGNTYTLLDTEKLILENRQAPGHDKNEARMILNHKEVFTFIRENVTEFKTLTKANLEKLHAVLVKDLSVGLGFRKKPVGILGSKYQPLDNIYQISEAVEILSCAVARMETPWAKALVALLGISYIQPFEDGNKRTSRLMANALLCAHGCAPLSYRSLDENEYREAMIVWYEVNSLIPFRQIFISQYDFAARNYAVK